MIARLRGTLAAKQPPWLLIDVAGVGYEVEAPMGTFYQLPETGAEVTLLIHMVVREDAQLLYGFATEGERRLFRHLLKISGVGAKMALGVLSGMSAEAFARSIREGDVAALVRLPGIGRKTAERLVVEMRDRLEDELLGGQVTVVMPSGATEAAATDPVRDAVSALVALGYKPQEASRLVAAVEGQAAEGSEALIRAALQSTVRKA